MTKTQMGAKRVLVAYASRKGAAGQAAQWIAEALGGCKMVDLKAKPRVDISPYDTIALGTGILAGRAHPAVHKFLRKRGAELAAKDLCIFITHLQEGEGIEADFRSAFDADTLRRARVRAGVGGRYFARQHNFFVRAMMRAMSEKAGHELGDYDTLSRMACLDFADRVREGL